MDGRPTSLHRTGPLVLCSQRPDCDGEGHTGLVQGRSRSRRGPVTLRVTILETDIDVGDRGV